MKRIATIIVFAVLMALTVAAQTLNVTVGSVTYKFPAAQTGDMTYTDGTTLTVMGKTFTLSDITSMTVDASSVTNNLVTVSYGSSSAAVTVAGNVAQYVEPTVSGAHVTIAQLNTDAVDDDEITYQLSGSTADGEFALSGAYKCTVSLAGLTLTNPAGAAINITNKKRIQISAKTDTENTLTDGADGSQKGCIYSKGQIQLQGKGTLNVYGNTAHAIKSGDYISVKNLTLNVLSSVKDAISCNGYFLMKSGTVSISGVGDDGIQCDLDGTESTGETADHEDEDSGNIYLEGGTLTISSSATAGKGVKAAGDMRVGDITINATMTGAGAWDEDDKDTKGAAGLSADGNITIDGGTLTLKATGTGGKGMKCDGTLTVNDGTINATATGSKYTYTYSGTSYSSSPKAIKAGVRTEDTSAARSYAPGGGGFGPGGGGGFGPGGGGNNNTKYVYTGGIVINGGTINAKSTNHEAIESKSTLDITGGYVYAEAGDDAINSASDFTITGGYVMGNSSGNDGLDANGNFYIKGGCVFAVASRSPEVGIDANTEGGYKLYITGGNVVAIGGLESGSSTTGVTTKSTSYSKGSWYTLSSGSTAVLTFKVPSNSSMGTSMAICTSGTPSVKSASASGTTFWNGYGCTGE
ncbi:MAG: carbohydrate-binding domain-containing protein [Prevotella sp.]|nr:carbohydrate-binding domain-containing protein [Prevotella sp.]MBQ8488049.1 carbohydrate-binding domain-containing protein [Prevotella sp.]